MPSELAVFVLASFAVAVVPGPDILYLVSRGVAQGRRAAVASALGVNTGATIHAGLAALGLSTVVQESDAVFLAIKYAGAAYLVYLAISLLIDRETPPHTVLGERTRLSRIFVQGVATDLLNPKVYLFFLAFVPQFIDPADGRVLTQTLVLGLTFVLVNLPVDLTVAWASGSLGDVLQRRAALAIALRWLSSSILLALAARIVRDAR